MHVLFVHSIEISISQTRKMILESSGRIRETSDFSAYAFGLFAAAIPLAQMILEKKNTLHRKETVEKLVQQMSSSSMNMEWFSRSVRDGTSVSVTSLSMSKLIGLVITASSKTSFSSLRDKFRYMEKIFVNELLEIEKNRDDMEKTWRGILEIDLSDKVLFEAVLETLRRRAKVVCWREIFMISDFEIVRDLNSKLQIRIQREGMFGTSRASSMFEKKLHETITYDVALFATRNHCFRVDGILQPADRIGTLSETLSSHQSPFSKRNVVVVDDIKKTTQRSLCGLGEADNTSSSLSSSSSSSSRQNFMTHPLVTPLFERGGGRREKLYVEDVVYENQARSGITNTFGTAWGLYLDPDGEGPWVHLKSGYFDVEDVEMFMPLNPDAVPKGWKWIDDWQVSRDVLGESDELGWSYGHSFSSIRCIGGSQYVTDTRDKRQRKWIRRRVPLRIIQQQQSQQKESPHRRFHHRNNFSRLHRMGRNPFASRFRHVRTQNVRRERLMSSRIHRHFLITTTDDEKKITRSSNNSFDNEKEKVVVVEQKKTKVTSKGLSLLKTIQSHNIPSTSSEKFMDDVPTKNHNKQQQQQQPEDDSTTYSEVISDTPTKKKHVSFRERIASNRAVIFSSDTESVDSEASWLE